MYKTNKGVEYLFTSVDVIKAIEFLIDVNFSTRRREKGMIRSNLRLLWHFFPNYETEGDKSSFGALMSRVMNYKHLKPCSISKNLRFLSHSTFSDAIEKALLFYYVKIPNEINP